MTVKKKKKHQPRRKISFTGLATGVARGLLARLIWREQKKKKRMNNHKLKLKKNFRIARNGDGAGGEKWKTL